MTGSSRNGGSRGRAEEQDVERLWQAFSQTRSPEVREKLVLHYAWLVKHVLGRLAIVLPPSLEYGDLLSHGSIALIDAVDRFEPARGTKFETYASVKIRGAILDAIRAMDFVSRPVRRRMRLVADALNRLTRDLGRCPSDRELAEALDITVAKLRRLYQQGAATLVSLDSIPAYDSATEGVALHESYADDNQPDPAEEAIRSEVSDMLASLIDSLPERDQLILSLYYREGLNMREIGEVLGISESRVCQLHGKSLLYLRSRLRHSQPELENDARLAASRLVLSA